MAKHADLGKLTALGDEAFYATTSTGGATVNTVVARQGTTVIQVVSTADLTRGLELAQLTLAAADGQELGRQ
ncbi:MAG: hypothetical protein ACLQPH_21785 [Acidimicrobiales bacterium]